MTMEITEMEMTVSLTMDIKAWNHIRKNLIEIKNDVGFMDVLYPSTKLLIELLISRAA